MADAAGFEHVDVGALVKKEVRGKWKKAMGNSSFLHQRRRRRRRQRRREGAWKNPFFLFLFLSLSLSLSLSRARACSLSSPFLPRAPLSHTPGAALRVRQEVRRPDHRRGQGSFLNDSVFSLSSVRRRLAPHFFPSPPLCLSFTPPSSHPPSATPNSQPTPTHQKKRGNRSSTHSKKRSRRGETSSTSTAATSSRSAGSTSSSCSRPRRRCSGTGSPRAGATTRRPRSRRTCSVR